jgi:hypothetical protein
MANSRRHNVVRLDTTGVVPGPAGTITAIRYIGDTGGSAQLRGGASDSQILWEASGDVETHDDLWIRAATTNDNMHITVAGGAVVYLYLK